MTLYLDVNIVSPVAIYFSVVVRYNYGVFFDEITCMT